VVHACSVGAVRVLPLCLRLTHSTRPRRITPHQAPKTSHTIPTPSTRAVTSVC